MKVTITILALILLGQTQLLAQDYFKPGSITKMDGNSTNGFISAKNLKKMSKFIVFKESEKGPEQKLFPEDVLLFNFKGGKHYISKTISENGTEKTVFLEYLVNGKASLYFLKDKHGEHYYIENDRNQLYELKNTQVENEVNEVKYYRDKKEYIGVLNTALEDYSSIQEETKDLKFNYKSLTKLTKNYHEAVCDEYECIVYNKDTKSTTSLGLFVGGFRSKLNVIEGALKRENFEPSTSYSIALLFSQHNIFGLSEGIGVNMQLGYRENTITSEKYRFYYQMLEVPIYVSYNIPTGKLQPLVNFGLKNTFIMDHQYISRRSGGELSSDRFLNNYMMNLFFGVGGEYKINKTTYMIAINFDNNKVDENISGRYMLYKLNNVSLNFGIKFNLN